MPPKNTKAVTETVHVPVADYKDGYDAGYAAAKAEAKPPLFEAAKRIAENLYHADQSDLDTKYAELEADYGETISRGDRGLLASIVRRLRMAEEVQRQAFLQVNRPKSAAGKQVAERIAEGRAETIYETA